MADNEELLQARNPTAQRYDQAIAPFVIPLLGQETSNLNALHYSILHCVDSDIVSSTSLSFKP